MNIRESLEALEESYASPYTSLSSRTRERDKSEQLCDIRPEYQWDKSRILHSKAFRWLKYKTQVFPAFEGGHYRTRLIHTPEVSQIARIIARTLRLSESLTEVIALGYNLGYTLFGHSGEYILNKTCEDGFTRCEQSVRIMEALEKDGRGLSLAREVRDGIRDHRTSGHPPTLRGVTARLSDKIAYTNYGIDDVIRAGVLMGHRLSRGYTDALSHSAQECSNNMIHDIILNSMDKLATTISEGMKEAMQGLRKWTFSNIYKNDISKAEEGKVQGMVTQLYKYHMGYVNKLPAEYVFSIVNKEEKKSRAVYDYIIGVGDIHAIDQFEELFAPRRQNVY